MAELPEQDRERIERDVRHAVAVHALKRIRADVDAIEAEERAQRRLLWKLLVAVAVICALGVLVVFWPGLGRFVSGLLG